ncbi:hypothetical protein BHOIPH791_14590 [Bartonella henselae]|nr:hypothetical protein BH623125_13720 [Bartonella henselae]GFF03721.1 hypothetical protein BH80429_05420 [Bartonella henselae]
MGMLFVLYTICSGMYFFISIIVMLYDEIKMEGYEKSLAGVVIEHKTHLKSFCKPSDL